MLLLILMVICGIIALTRDKLVIFRNRSVNGQDSKIVGIILIVGAVVGLFVGGVQLIALIAAIVYGLAKAQVLEA